MLYAIVLTIHSWLRWVVLLAGLAAYMRAQVGASRRSPWTPGDDRAGLWFSILLDVQVLVGLVLYIFLSPFTHAAFGNLGDAMRNSGLRFWAVEHVTGMIIAIGLVHIGRSRVRKADERRRHRVASIFYGLALVAMAISIPWPGMVAGRPLLRW
ncbi:MAG: hypothetical protein ACJ731_03875 [Vicinamibacterales bacterium]